MRALIIITLIVLILTVYFRYENFQMSNNELNFDKSLRRFTRFKKKVPNAVMKRINGDIIYYNKHGNFFRGKGKNFILPGVFHRPMNGRTIVTKFLMGRPKSSDSQINNLF